MKSEETEAEARTRITKMLDDGLTLCGDDARLAQKMIDEEVAKINGGERASYGF